MFLLFPAKTLHANHACFGTYVLTAFFSDAMMMLWSACKAKSISTFSSIFVAPRLDPYQNPSENKAHYFYMWPQFGTRSWKSWHLKKQVQAYSYTPYKESHLRPSYASFATQVASKRCFPKWISINPIVFWAKLTEANLTKTRALYYRMEFFLGRYALGFVFCCVSLSTSLIVSTYKRLTAEMSWSNEKVGTGAQNLGLKANDLDL